MDPISPRPCGGLEGGLGMPKPYVPGLDLISNLDDEVRFYATIGIIVGLWGAFEGTLFQFFEKASGIPHDLAASIYYRVRSDKARSEMTNLAMLHKLAGRPELSQWKDLYKRLDNSAEITRYRNLVAHNPVLRQITMPAQPEFFRRDPASTGMPVGVFSYPEPRPPEVRHTVSLDPVKVAAGKENYEADITKLREICADLDQLHTDLDAFYATL
jgi:hypothetical protein